MIKDILKDLVSFNTINDLENDKIIDYIESYLKKLGFKVDYKTKCLVMSNRPNANIGFLGHTDTVSYNDWNYNPFSLKEENGKLYGLGTCDMKGGIAAILSAVSKVNFKNKGIKLIFTYDEEIGFSGINELLDNNITFPKYMIIGEPTNNKVINASKGLLELRLTFKGVSSHSSSPGEGVNAILKCNDFINKLKILENELKNTTINNKVTTMNIGVINGGRSVNIVPNICTLEIDFRTILPNQNDYIIDKITKMIDKDTNVEIINNIKPFKSKGKVCMSDFITEASFINSPYKYILGVGPNNAHKKDEFIEIDGLEKLEKQYINMIENKIKE